MECDYSSIEYIILLYLYTILILFNGISFNCFYKSCEGNVLFILFSKIAFHFPKLQYISWSTRSPNLNIIELL